jgi:ATP-dependent exoDNAse (exonuclease V) beta subunit
MIQKQFIHELIDPRVELISEESEGSRFYKTPSGNYPSVTTVTGWEKRKFFAEWRKNNPEEAKRTVNRGNRIHKLIEKYLKNEILDKKEIDPFTLDLFLQIQPQINKIDNINAMETSLYSDKLKLAGRVDCIAKYQDKLSIIDFKGSTKPKRKEDIDNYFMQATAYSIMWKELTGISIKNIVILITCDDGAVQVFEQNPVNYVKKLVNAIKLYESEAHAKV